MASPVSTIIIGGGVIGCCTAYYAMLKGHRVTLVERAPRSQNGCSMGNGGMIVPSHFIPLAAPGMVSLGMRMIMNPEGPFSIRPWANPGLAEWSWLFYRSATKQHVERCAPVLRDLNLASRRCYEELADLPEMDFGLVRKGLLMLCKTQHALDEEAKAAEMANALGVPAEVLSPHATAERDPAIRMDVAGSVHFPLDCHFVPGRFMAAIIGALERGGVNLLWSTEVAGCRTDGRRVVALKTDAGDLTADEYVLAGGAWSQGLARGLGLRLPMQAGKGYSMTLPSPRQLPEICSILTEARVAVTPMGSALRFAGTMEVGGLDQSVNSARVRGIVNSIPRYFPEFHAEDFGDAPVWVGLRPCSPDGMPYIGRTSRYDNLLIGTGHAMMGMSLGPVTGQLLAQLLSAEKPLLPLDAVSPDRWS
ncbi:MAG TPA: FAD-dependent oxidoreductase [Armatimonadota bacterium]|jgi:D-amino-acid dehydrogenase